MSLYHTYIASRPKADSVIQGITIPSQINQRMRKTVPIFNLHEYSCLAPHTMNNYINKLSCLYIYRTKKLLVRSTCVGPYLIFPKANIADPAQSAVKRRYEVKGLLFAYWVILHAFVNCGLLT